MTKNQTKKLIHKNKTILKNMKYATSTPSIAKGLMFAGKKKIQKGICMKLPTKEDVKYNASVTMFFCFSSLQIIFINSDYKIVDKVTLKPFKANYTPKDKCRYIIESTVGTFDNLKIGDKVEIK